MKTKTLGFALTGLLAACQGTPDTAPSAIGLDDVQVGEAGKADMVSSAHILDDIDLNSEIRGTFRPGWRVYGFTFEAKAGARIQVGLRATAGTGSVDLAPGEALDTVAAIYGPMSGADKGPRLATAEDEEGGAAVLPGVDIARDGKYLVIFSSWNDPGAGAYAVNVGCEGTNFQCRRPVAAQPCVEGTRYIQGQTVVGTETWDRCNVVLLENTVVAPDAILTIQPGVRVQGNIIGAGPYGDVALEVQGKLQAVGTAEHPVVFTAVRDGWKGLVLQGASNTLEHVFIEKARTGVQVAGGHNTFTDVTVDHGETGFRFDAGSAGNRLSRIRLDQVTHGVVLGAEAAADIDDAVLVGKGDGVGLRGAQAAASTLERSIITGFGVGIDAHTSELAVTDSTIAANTVGVRVDGPESGLHPAFTCPDFPTAPPPSNPPPSFPREWPRDPIFVRTDIVDNTQYGVRVLAPQLVVIEESNVRRNKIGVSIEADSLHEQSRIRASNVTDNGDAWQVDAWHTNGVLDISGNFWNRISDPELSASWRVTHEMPQNCRLDNPRITNCTWLGNDAYRCGAWHCAHNGQRYICNAPTVSRWTGRVTFTGFSPEALRAGPDLQTLLPAVNAERARLGLEAGVPEEEPAFVPGTVAVSEVDYDQPGADSAEFVELTNPGEEAVALRGYALELVDGASGRVYGRFDLGAAGATLEPGQYLVVGAPKVIEGLPASVLRLRLSKALQNGAPDGVRVVGPDGRVVDGLAYEGRIEGTGEGASPSDREGNGGPNRTLARCGDTDDNAADFRAAAPTPGAVNACR